MSVKFTIPIRTVSEANAHTHWRVRQKRAKEQRGAAFSYARIMHDVGLPKHPLRITLCRIAPRMLDSDNAVGALKHVRDGLADAMCLDDNDPRLEWVYAPQRKGKPKEYAVEVEITPLTPAAAEKE